MYATQRLFDLVSCDAMLAESSALHAVVAYTENNDTITIIISNVRGLW